jgi:hypothetical protein
LALAAIPERDRVLEELVRKLPTGDSVLALSDRELDRTLPSCFVERVTNAHGPLPGPRFFSAGELENLYPVPAARLQELNDRLMESCQRLLTGGYVMPAVGQYGGSMTVTAKGRKGLPPELDYNAISAALWVLECETSCKQGTAFALEDVGLVSCEHVLGPDTRAFKARLHRRNLQTPRWIAWAKALTGPTSLPGKYPPPSPPLMFRAVGAH